MKILFCPCHYIYGQELEGSEVSWAYQIAHRLTLKNSGSVVVTGKKNTSGKENYRIIEIHKNKEIVDLGLVNAFIFNIKYFLWTIRLINQEKFDLIHHVLPFGLGGTFNLALLLGLNKNTPFIIGPLQLPLYFYDNPSIFLKVMTPILQLLSRQTLFRANKLIAINTATKKFLIGLGIPPEKIEIIPPGIDTRDYQNIRRKTSGVFRFLTVGYLTDRKAVDLIIKALALVVRKNQNISLSIVGGGPNLNNLKSLVRKLNLQKNVVFIGQVPHSQIRAYYQSANVFVSMSRAESWGQVYLEAMASGLPVIASKNDGSVEIIEDQKSGFLIDQENYRELANLMSFLAAKPRLAVKIGQKARKIVEKKYDWQKVIIPKYTRVYQNLL